MKEAGLNFSGKRYPVNEKWRETASSLEAGILFSKLTYQKRVVKPCFEGKLYTHLGKLFIFNIQVHESLKSTLQILLFCSKFHQTKKKGGGGKYVFPLIFTFFVPYVLTHVE